MSDLVRGTLIAAGLAVATLAALLPLGGRHVQTLAYGDPSEDARFCAYIADDRVVGRAPCESLARPPVRTASSEPQDK